MRIGPTIYRWRWLILLSWLGVGAGLCVTAPRLDPASHEPDSFLPADSDYSRAADALRESFPHSSGLSQAVVVFERAAGLTPADLAAVEAVAASIARARPPITTGRDLEGISVRSPAGLPLKTNPLKSPDGAAALVIVDVPANFITIRSSRMIDHVRNVLEKADLPPGLAAAVTGSSGFGHDYALAAEASHRNIGLVTLAAVVVILLLVYRSPLAALVPLVAISAAAFVAMKVLAIGQHFGMHVGTGEKVFVFVLIYGAGMDYSMLFISRFREGLSAGLDRGAAGGEGLGATLAAILASAGTDTLGLLMLSAAEYRVFQTAGLAIAAALIVALAASVTMVPALAGIFGRSLFWPGRVGTRQRPGPFAAFWPAVGRLATGKPFWVLAIVLALLAVPGVRGARLRWVYDALAELDPAAPAGVGNAAAGIQSARRHWAVGQIAPVTVLVRADAPLPAGLWRKLAGELTDAVRGAPGVNDVRSLTQPVGGNAGPGLTNLEAAADWLKLQLASARVRAEYLSADGRAMRLQAVLDKPSLNLAAMDDLAGIRRTVEQTLSTFTPAPATSTTSQAATAPARPKLAAHFAGATAEMAAIRSVTQADFHRVAALVLAVIFVMILVLLRDPILSAFIVAATGVSYLATLGLAYWIIALAGQDGLDWKVEVFLFVVMVAVGVDYSIFLAARVSQEARTLPVDRAVQNAVVHTGPVISSCGLIMAATLGSLMAGRLKLFVQLGLAMSLGMLIDTFVIRPLLLPAFITLAKRTGRIPRFLE